MKQLCEELQNEFRDIASCTISPYTQSIHVKPTIDKDFFSQCDILTITQYCLAHNLYFLFDCKHGLIVVYEKPIF